MSLLLVAVPGAEASGERLSATLRMHASPDAVGALDLASSAAGVDLAPDGAPGALPRLQWDRAQGTLHKNAWIVAGGVPVSLPTSGRGSEPVDLSAGRLTGLECLAGCQVLLFPIENGSLRVDARVDGPLPVAPEKVRYWAEMDDNGAGAFLREFPAGSLVLGGVEGNATASGEQLLFAKGARLHVETVDGASIIDVTGEREEVGPLGTLTRANSRFLVLQLDAASLRASLRDVRVVAPEASARLEGRLTTPDASGSVVLGGTTHALDHGRLEVDGTLDLSWVAAGSSAPPASPLAAPHADPVAGLEGKAREAWIDGRLVAAASPIEAPPSLVAALVAALLVLARLALPLYSRIPRDRVLSNANRRRLWETLSARPGQTMTALARASGISRVVVRHHMALLAAHGFVLCVARGRRKLYFPRGRSPAPDVLAVQDALADGSRLLVARAVAGAHATQSDIARATGFSPRVVSYHLAHLERLGLVRAEGAWRRTYQATPRLAATLTPQEA